MLGLSVLYWRRSAGRDPYDALQLLALLFLIRCVLDPLTISYHHAPFVLTIAMFEGLRYRRMPIVTLTSTAAILVLGDFISPLGKPDLMYGIYFLWALSTITCLTVAFFGRLGKLLASMRLPEQPSLSQPYATP